jgi:exosortase/archaeosortase family protein
VVFRLQPISFFLRDRLNLFYLLAFAPLTAVAYFSIIRAVIPMYAFVLLLLKKDRLSSFGKPGIVQTTLGVLILVTSLFTYFVLIPLFSFTYTIVDPYGIANYVLHLLGLFLVFFSLQALREAFSPLFLIIATTSSFFISESLAPALSPILIPFFMHVIDALLKILGYNITTNYSMRTMTLQTWRGPVPAIFDWGCVGVYSTLVFTIILIVILFEEKSILRTKILWAVIGVIGTNIVNVIRVLTIFLTDYAFGAEAGAQVHYFVGYVLFITWLVIFFLFMSRRPLRRQIDSSSKNTSLTKTNAK